MQLDPLPFARLMGVSIVSVAPDLVIGELKVREDLCTRPNVLHGGAYMAFADTIGAVATVANLKEGETTTTIESKTNRSEEHTSELQSRFELVCRLLLEKK